MFVGWSSRWLDPFLRGSATVTSGRVGYRATMFIVLAALGDSDCEAIDGGLLAQPANALSSLAFTIVGLALIPWALSAPDAERRVRGAVVAGLVLTGIGSLLYHGPQGPGSQFAHDISFLVVLLVIGVADIAAGSGRSMLWSWTVTTVLVVTTVVALVAFPTATNLFTGGTLVVVVIGDILLHRGGHRSQPWYAIAMGAMLVAIGAFVFGRSGAWLCDPSSHLQAHAAWHLVGAIALGSYAVATGAARVERRAAAGS